MRLLTIPKSNMVYVRRLNEAFRKRGLQVDETPFPYVRWPRNLLRFLIELTREHGACQMHWSVFDSRAVMRLFFRLGLPKVWTVHNLVPHEPLFKDDLAVSSLYLRNVDVAVWHSPRSIEDAKKAFAARGLPVEWSAEDVVIPLMSFNDSFPDRVSGEEARRRLGLAESEFVVGHFGPTALYKGTDVFLELPPVARGEDLTFLIFGACHDPRLAERIKAAARANPRLKVHLDPIPDEELQYWFRACDLVVQPYTDITTSGSIMFPIAFSKPVVASPLGNIPDVIQPGKTGWLAATAPEIYRSIQQAKASPEAARAMGRRAHAFVDETAGLDRVADAYLQIYERLARR